MQGFLVDTSVWVAAFFTEHESFSLSHDFLSARDKAHPAWFCRATEQSWLRLVTTPSLHKLYKTPPLTNTAAAAVLANWHGSPGIRCLEAEPEGTRELWLDLAATSSASPKVWMDAYLAAFSIRAELPLATLDTDFRRFESAGLTLQLLAQ